MLLTINPAAPEAVAFDIDCSANPNQLSAQSFWHQSQPPDGSEKGLGTTTFSSGVTTYVAKGQGQTAYTVYTLVEGRTACQIITYETDPFNTKIVTATVNSFTWQ